MALGSSPRPDETRSRGQLRTLPPAADSNLTSGDITITSAQSLPGGGQFAIADLASSPSATSQKVGLYIPPGVTINSDTQLAIYLHGHGGGIKDTVERQRLTEWAKGQNVVFVIPQLGPRSNIKGGWNVAGATKFIDDVSKAIGQMTHTNPGTLKNNGLIVMSYSGGYRATQPFLHLPNTKELVAWDTMYGNSADFAAFANRADHPKVSVYVGPSTRGGTEAFRSALRSGANVGIENIPNNDHMGLVQNVGPRMHFASAAYSGQGKGAPAPAPSAVG
jgi:hypothetical protein